MKFTICVDIFKSVKSTMVHVCAVTATVAVLLAFTSAVTYESDDKVLRYETPFTWKKRDSFDTIMDKFSSVNAENCMTKSEDDITLPTGSVSQIPKFNELHKPIFFQNRSSLVHALKMSLNRAFYFSYIMQSQNASATDFVNNPGLMYYFMSTTADVTANPGFINGSAIYFDNGCHYPNWLTKVLFNSTIRLFASSSWRVDDYNEPTNRIREPTNNTVDAMDWGAGYDSNYTHPVFKPNPWYHKWLPDILKGKDTIEKFTRAIGIQASNQTGVLQPMQETPFFGPPQPKEIGDEGLPVLFTLPYFDCGRSNRWVISATSPVIDYFPRYTDYHHLR